MGKTITIGADHGGFKLKERIKVILKKTKYKIEDVGTYSDEACDYPVFGFNAAKKVSQKKAEKGIVICKSGIGMSIIANKLPGVRAGVCANVADAASSRKHNDTNVLVLSASKLSGKKAEEIVKTWMKTSALKGRHARRVKQIIAFEKQMFK